MSDLLIPATPALLRGWTGPVVLDDGREAALVCALDGVALVALNGWMEPEPGPGLPGAVWWEPGPLRLDLAQDAAADRVARVLAEVVAGQPLPGSGYSFWFDGGYPSADRVWRLSRPNSPCAAFVEPRKRRPFVPAHGVLVDVPALAAIAPDDPDADLRALQAVVAEVCGG